MRSLFRVALVLPMVGFLALPVVADDVDEFTWDGAADGTVFYAPTVPGSETLIWPGVTLKDVRDVMAARGGTHNGSGLANPITISRTDDEWHVQFQMNDDHLKMVYVKFFQREGGVAARATEARYVDFTTRLQDRYSYWGVYAPNSVTSGSTIEYYNVKALSPILDSGAGDYTLTNNSPELAKSWNVSNGVVRIRLSGTECVTLNKEIRGNAALFIDGAPVETELTDIYPGNNDNMVVAENVPLARFLPIGGRAGGSAAPVDKNKDQGIFFLVQKANEYICQLQFRDDTYLKYLKLTFKQINGNITIRVSEAGYVERTKITELKGIENPVPGDYDFSVEPVKDTIGIATAVGGSGCGLKDLTYRVIPGVVFGGDNSVTNDAWTEPRIYLKDAWLGYMHFLMMPKNAQIKVYGCGMFEQCHQAPLGAVPPYTDLGFTKNRGDWHYYLFPGSEARFSTSWTYSTPRIVADHATIRVLGSGYIDRLILGNGTLLTGTGSFNCGYPWDDGIGINGIGQVDFITYGTPSRVTQLTRLGISGTTGANKLREFRLYGDLTVDVPFGSQGSGYRPKSWTKRGPATLTLTKKTPLMETPIVIEEGKIVLQTSESLQCLATMDTRGTPIAIADPGIVLDGGTLELADGVTNTIFALRTDSRTNTSEIVLGVGARLYVTNGLSGNGLSSALRLSGELKDDGSNLQIGPGAVMTAADLAQVRHVEGGSRRHVMQLDDGGICLNRAFLLIFR